MSLFDELYDEVVTTTKRPDQGSFIKQAIKLATAAAHNADEWPMDKQVIVAPVITESDYYGIDTQIEPFVRFKKALAVMDYPETRAYTRISSEDIFNEWHGLKQNIFYQIGYNLIVRSDNALSSARVSYLQKPNTSELEYSSWIARDYREVIVNKATSLVYGYAGNDAEKRNWEVLYREGILELQRIFVEVTDDSY